MLDVHTDYKDRHIFTRLVCKIYNFNNNYIYTSLRLLNTCNCTKFITQLNTCNGTKFITQGGMINFCVFMVTAILNHNKYDMIVMHEMLLTMSLIWSN